MPKEKMNIKSMLATKQALLESKLTVLLEHPVTKGDHCEGAWIDFFRSFLPSKFAVDKGFVFDSEGSVSEQIDIIIYDALYAPLIFGTDAGEKFVTAESVYAIFESKSEINQKTLAYANEKVKSVADLERSRRGVIDAGIYRKPRELTHIIGGILAVKAISNTSISQYLNDNPCIDIGCAIMNTSFIVERDENGQMLEVPRFSRKEESILSFFYIVLDELYKLGTVAGIDIRDYADATVDSLKLARRDADICTNGQIN